MKIPALSVFCFPGAEGPRAVILGGTRCHIAALLDIPSHNTKKNSLKHTPPISTRKTLSDYFWGDFAVMSSLTLSGRVWQQLWEKVHQVLKTQIISCVEKSAGKQKLQNMGSKTTKYGKEIYKIWEAKLQNMGSKSTKYGKEIYKIWEAKATKSK